jgi:hypothetical protein
MGKKKEKHIDLENQRYGLFMDDGSFDLDVMYGEHYLDVDVNYFVLIHKVNIIETKSHDLYGQTKARDKKYLPPVKINVMINIAEKDGEYYAGGEGGISRDDTGELRISVYLNELERVKLEIDRGDIIEFNQSGERARYYEVDSAQNVVDSTQQTIAGFKPYWKQIVGIPVKEDITPFLNGDSLR